MTTKAIGYVRVSTDEQADHGISLEMQAAKVRAYAELNDLDLLDVIQDAGISGKSIKGRPGIQAVLDMVRARKVSAVITYSLSRLARNTIEALEIAKLMDKAGVALHSISEKLDTQSALGRFFFTLTASLAEMERRLISERTTAALSQKRARGGRVSRHAPYGFTFDTSGNLRVDDTEQHTIAKVHELRSQGYSIRGIVEYLGENGYCNRSGKSFGVAEVWKIAKAA